MERTESFVLTLEAADEPQFVHQKKTSQLFFFLRMVAKCRYGQNGDVVRIIYLGMKSRSLVPTILTSCEGKLSLTALQYEAYV